jgi:hypothetical protein
MKTLVSWRSDPTIKTDRTLVEPYMADLLEPIAIESVKLLEYIPYARRRITKVLPPQPDARRPAYTSQLCCIVTVPSPWTEAEGWRRCPLAQSEHETDVPADVEDAGPLELEEATVEDPARLTIWIERSALGNDSTGQSLVGMALRGRWGLFGNASEGNRNQWWAFRSKNCKLLILCSALTAIDNIQQTFYRRYGLDQKEKGRSPTYEKAKEDQSVSLGRMGTEPRHGPPCNISSLEK